MSRRTRAVIFVLGALLAAAFAAAIADDYGASVAHGYGPLRSVAVATATLRPGERIGPRRAASALETRRVPARFVPAGALREPAEAIGLAPTATVSAGAYLLASQLRPPESAASAPTPDFAAGRRPVPISVSGAAALAASGSGEEGGRVDVVVTTEPTGSGHGHTYVAAAGVPLLSLTPAPDGVEGTATATLALTRRQALRLIAAESFARQLTLLPGA
jgi:pilus assembly protein CpaB